MLSRFYWRRQTKDHVLRVNASNYKILLTDNIRRKKRTALGSMVSLHLYFILQFRVKLINSLNFGFVSVVVVLMNAAIVHSEFCFRLLPSFGCMKFMYSFLMCFIFCCYNWQEGTASINGTTESYTNEYGCSCSRSSGKAHCSLNNLAVC